MEFCIGTCAKIDQVDLIRQAEDLGVTHFGVGEGPLLFSDPYQRRWPRSRPPRSIWARWSLTR
jgi:hypothetical protein